MVFFSPNLTRLLRPPLCSAVPQCKEVEVSQMLWEKITVQKHLTDGSRRTQP